MTKRCSKCDECKSIDHFNKKGSGFQPWCRECNRLRSRRYYAENREKHLTVIKERQQRILEDTRKKYCDYLKANPCMDCPETDILVLEPDHVRGEKKHNLSSMMKNGYSWSSIVDELKKCDIVCCNCHKRRTYARLTTGSYRMRY